MKADSGAMSLSGTRMRARKRRVWLGAALVVASALAVDLCGVADAASPKPLCSTDGMVVSEAALASLAGVEVLVAGGNAADAAVAVGFALAVVYPEAGNLGGGGFALVHSVSGQTEALDFREVAPAASSREMFLGPDGAPDESLSTQTALASGVPGTVAGLALLHERHGSLPWARLLEPAIRLARNGFALDAYTASSLMRHYRRLSRHPESLRILLNGGRGWEVGDTLVQPELAETLERIARLGPREFYEGRTAQLLVREMESQGGILAMEDLADYRALVRKPLRGTYRGYTILSMPPPSSGGVALIQMLGIMERLDPGSVTGNGSSLRIHLMAEAMRRAFADRAVYLGDPDYSPIPLDGLIAPGYLDSLASSIDPRRASKSDSVGAGKPPGWRRFFDATGSWNLWGRDEETTHFCVVDGDGNAVSVTTTLNTSYGSGVMVTGAGFLLNNEMDDFAAAPGKPNIYGLIQGEANAVRPGARPLSSMTPTIVLRGDSLAYVLGSPGGPRIITSVFQVLAGMIDFGLDPQAAVDAPRVHHQWRPDTLWVERLGFAEDVLDALRRMGHRVSERGSMGSVQVIAVSHGSHGCLSARAAEVFSATGRRMAEGRVFLGASDPRRNGCPVGLSAGRFVSRCARCGFW